MKIMKVFNKIHFRVSIFTVFMCFLVITPRVMAMSLEQIAVIHPYKLAAFFFGICHAVVQFIKKQRFFYWKRYFDVIISVPALLIAAPLVIICAVLIKVFSPRGPVLYTQKRVGKDGINFEMYKLRSMIPDAEIKTGAVWSTGDNDPRMIPYIGRVLRKTHLDEIPQFINVLKGDMSVVGPRPERPEIVESLKKNIPEYEKRLAVNPGITGLAQIRLRYDKTLADVKKKVKLDLLYIRKMCLISELRIMFLTLLVVVTGKVIG